MAKKKEEKNLDEVEIWQRREDRKPKTDGKDGQEADEVEV